MAQCSTIPTESILFLIEQFLLPAADDHYLPANMKKRRNVCTFPTVRLDHILYQVALADHIRMAQIMYRDSEDDLCLAPELRVGDISIKLPTKHLIQKITEGRSRILALSRCCFEENSFETLRALVDLTSSYALQGMWPQVSDNVAQVSHLLSLKDTISDSDEEKQRLKKQHGKRSAHRVNCCYKLLRTHAILCRGYLSASFINELEIGLSPPLHADSVAKQITRTDESAVSGADPVTELMEELRILFKVKLLNTLDSNLNLYEDDADKRCKDLRLSWGDVVNFFREESVVMQKWMDDVEGSLLPQNIAALHLPFRTCDEQRKGIAHPIQLCEAFMRFSNALKVIAGSTLLKQLRNLDIAMPILIDRKSGNIGTVKEWDANAEVQNDEYFQVVYELPVTWEEVLSKHVEEANLDPLGLLKAQVLSLSGVTQTFTDRPSLAENSFKSALSLLEDQGLGMELNACELYNSIAQLMMNQHRASEASKKSRLKLLALEWAMDSEEGQLTVLQTLELMIEQHVQDFRPYVLSDLEEKAKNKAVKNRAAVLTLSDINPYRDSLETAYRYLVQSYEILLEAHGDHHPAVATGCLAVASVQNVLEGFEESRAWLTRSLRCLETLLPLPVRAISFVQLQLSQVLFKLGREEDSLEVLIKASEFHWSAAECGLALIEKDVPLGISYINPPHKGQLLYDDIMMAVDLAGRIVSSLSNQGKVAEAATVAEDVADLLDRAFDWDCIIVAEARKESGQMHAMQGDWSRAVTSYRRSLEGFEAVCGNKDKRITEVSRLLNAAEENKVNGQRKKTLKVFNKFLSPAPAAR